MISIFVCEDQKTIRDAIEKEINNHVMIHNYDMELVLCTHDPQTLLQQVRQSSSRGIYFLDIDLGEDTLDGFELGNEIRKYDSRGFIIYVTAFSNMAFKTFQYHLEALDYIVKEEPVEMFNGIRRCLDTIVARIAEEANDEHKEFYTIKIMDTIKHIPIDEIFFFETSSRTHRIILYSTTQRIDFIGTLQEIEDELTPRFIRTHRSYLVNIDNIQEINPKKNEIILKNGQVCPISRKMKTSLLAQFEQRL